MGNWVAKVTVKREAICDASSTEVGLGELKPITEDADADADADAAEFAGGRLPEATMDGMGKKPTSGAWTLLIP